MAESKKDELCVSKALKRNGFLTSFIRCSAPPLSPTPTQEIESDNTNAEEAEKQTTVSLQIVQGLSELITGPGTATESDCEIKA